MKTIRFYLVFLLGLSMCSTAIAARADIVAIVEAAISDPENDEAFNAYLDTLPKVSNPLQKSTVFYLVEGDMPFTEKQVRAYLRSKSSAPVMVGHDNSELLVHIENGKQAFWEPEARTLRYAVMRASFPSQDRYDKVIADIVAASGDWVDACPDCGLQFVHKPEFDSVDDPLGYIEALNSDELRFVVFYSDVTSAEPANAYIARAFFPSTPRHLRSVIVDSSYFGLESRGSRFTGSGVMRHELGHVLGYRHEHIQGIPGCRSEGTSWRPLTPYDGKSVMHYNCGPSADRGDLILTNLDKDGHRKLYGPQQPSR